MTCKIGFFGALTGDAANLGINIKNGADLAVKQYNEKHEDCKVKLKQFDSQGNATQAPALAKKAIDDKTVIGIVGPAFSGESKAADPAFNEAGLTTITPSATNPALAKNGWKTFFRALGNDAVAGPRGREVHQGRPQGHQGVRHGRRVGVRQGPGRHRQVRPRPAGHRHRHASSRSRPTSPPPSPRSRPPARDALFYGGYYAEAGLLVKQLRTPAGRAPSSSATASRTTATSRPVALPPRARS